MAHEQLTQHFNLAEFTRSAIAAANGIDNDVSTMTADSSTMTDDHDSSTMTIDHDNDSSTMTIDHDHDLDHDRNVIENLRNLCTEVLEPLREHFGIPVIVTSGYRCPELNRLVGGTRNSQHLVGEAADIVPSTMTDDHDHDSTMTDDHDHDSTMTDDHDHDSTMTDDHDHDSNSAGKRSSSSSKVRVESLREWFLFIQDNCCFDQLILETKKGRSWIHVSCCRDKSRNRQTSFTMKR